MEDILKNLSTYGYLVLFLYSLGGGFIALLAAGVLSFSGQLSLPISIAVAFAGNVIGDTLLFYMARYHKSEMTEYISIYKRKVAYSHILMKKHGSWLIIVKKFIYGLKTIITLAIGISKYSFWKFSVYNVIGSFIWAVSIGTLSYVFGGTIIHTIALIPNKGYIAPIAFVTIAGLILLLLHFSTKKKPKKSI